MLTEARLIYLREKEARDKVAFKWMLIAFPIIIASVALFVVADTWRVPFRSMIARVMNMRDTWTLRNGQRCVTTLETELGAGILPSKGLCSDVAWHFGSADLVKAKKLRLTGAVIISPDQSWLRGGHPVYPLGR